MGQGSAARKCEKRSESEMDPFEAGVPTPVVRRRVLGGLLGGGALATALTAFGPTVPAHADPTDSPFVAANTLPVNVKDYGAVGDGKADDTAAVQQAVTAAEQSGRSVFFPAGVYVLSEPIQLSGPTTWLGEGMWHSNLRRTSEKLFVTFTGRADRLTLVDLGFDGAGAVSNLFELDVATLGELVVQSCRFTNLVQGTPTPTDRAFYFAAFQIRGLRNAEFRDCLWHNPAKYAGYGMGVHVPVDAGAGRIAFTGNNRFLWLNHAMRILSGDARSDGKDNSTEVVQIDGAYFDEYWWLLPAGRFGEGGTVTYRADGLDDSKANFSEVIAGRYPVGTTVRAMPVRRSGSTSSADGRSFTEDGVDFSALGIKRGELVRAGNSFAVVEAVAQGSTNRVIIENWLDNDTLLPAAPPAVGTDYVLYGILLGAIASRSTNGLTFASDAGMTGRWYDLHGQDVVPPAGTRYEVLQTRPGYHVLIARGVQNARVINSTFRRSYFDQLSGWCQNYQVIGNLFMDGQDVGFSGSFQGRHQVVDNDFVHQGSRAVHVNGDNDLVTGNRSSSPAWIHEGSGNAHYVLEGWRGGYAGHNIGVGGGESVRQGTPGILLRFPAASRPSDTCTDNLIEHNRFTDLTGPEVSVWDRGGVVTGNRIVGAESITYRGAQGQWVQTHGTGSPEGELPALPGSTYLRTDGGPGETLYVKESGTGATGWSAK